MSSSEEEKLTFCQKFGNGCASFGKFMYNSEAGEVMGRTGQSWAKIGLFYLVFYGFLAGFFSAMLAVFLSTINDPSTGGPKLTQYIKNQAGLTRIGGKNVFENYDNSSTEKRDAYTETINDFFSGYNNTDVYGGVCDPANNKGTPKGSKACVVNNTLLGPCSPDINGTDFGFSENKPCIFLKINKVYDWVPDVPGDFLKLKCKKSKALIGVYPEGFLLSAFPFRGVKGHQLPLVAVKIDAKINGKDDKVDCDLDDIETSESYNPTRSYGKIRIEDVYA